jgi:hypothetical protein
LGSGGDGLGCVGGGLAFLQRERVALGAELFLIGVEMPAWDDVEGYGGEEEEDAGGDDPGPDPVFAFHGRSGCSCSFLGAGIKGAEREAQSAEG